MSDQPTRAKPPTFGDAINAVYLTIIHSCLALQKFAMGSEECVDLVRNEIGNLDEIQQIRMDLTKAERITQRIAIDKELAELSAA